MSSARVVRRISTPEARRMIRRELPGFAIKSLRREGEGVDHVAFRVNRILIFRFPKRGPDPRNERRELAALRVARQLVSIAIPVLAFRVPLKAFRAYRRVPGVPLLSKWRRLRRSDLRTLARDLGRFISSLAGVSRRMARGEGVALERLSLAARRREASQNWRAVRGVVPRELHRTIRDFLSKAPPRARPHQIFCHNDLGIDHVFVSERGARLLGVIDWSDACWGDVAGDLGLLYRDLGAAFLDDVLHELPLSQTLKQALRKRALYIGKCSVFEDLRFGLRPGNHRYRQKSLAGLRRMFGKHAET